MQETRRSRISVYYRKAVASTGGGGTTRLDFYLALAFWIRAIVNAIQTVALLVFPEVIVPGFVHDTHLLHKNHDNLWPILRVFALQTGCLMLVDLMVLRFHDWRDKARVNRIFFLYHLIALVNMFVSGWVWSPAFIISPLFYHGPTTILHGLVALQEWREPKAKHGGADIIRSQ